MWQVVFNDREAENEIVFIHKITGERRPWIFSWPIMPISRVDTSSMDEVFALFRDMEGSHNVLYHAEPGCTRRIKELTVAFRLHSWRDREEIELADDPFNAYVGLFSSMRHSPVIGERLDAMRWASHGLYFDLPFHECYQRFREIEDTMRQFSLELNFDGRIGICRYCEKEISLLDHWNDLIGNACSECRAKEEIKGIIRGEKENLVFRKKLNTALRERGHVVPVPCDTCGNEVLKAKRCLHGQPIFCSSICKRVKFPPKARKLKYTPAYLDFLLRQDVAYCHEIGCDKPQEQTENPWGLCSRHLRLLRISLAKRKETRQRLVYEAV